ncbi:CheF family chemotaxis protein [Halomicroarcula sp. GCM10025710]
MSSVLADFTGTFAAETPAWDGPVDGRILLGKGQLVLAAGDDDTVRIPLDSVFDVSVGSTPNFFDPMPGTPVTVAYRERDNRLAVAVAADEGTIEKFVTVLYKAMLNGTDVTLKHPAKVGGRVTDAEFKGGLLSLQTGAVEFDTDEGPVTIPLDSVIDFDRMERAVDGTTRPVLVVSHMDGGTALTTLAAIDSNRSSRYSGGTSVGSTSASSTRSRSCPSPKRRRRRWRPSTRPATWTSRCRACWTPSQNRSNASCTRSTRRGSSSRRTAGRC